MPYALDPAARSGAGQSSQAMERFITFEGGEAVGKSSLIQKIASWMSQRGLPYIQSREPGGTAIAENIRAVFMQTPGEKMNAVTESLLINAARSEHCEKVILPALASGRFVLCDRFIDSTYIYQGILGGVDKNFLQILIKMVTKDLLPTLTFLLDCDPAISAERIQGRQIAEADNRYDAAPAAFHEKLRKAHLEHAMKHKDRIIVLDSAAPLEVLVQQATEKIRERFAID